MKRQILMASAAMLLSLAGIAGNSTKDKSCCNGNCCTKVCAKKCVCDSKKCTPATCVCKVSSKGATSDKSKK